jgi:hypothetical protein
MMKPAILFAAFCLALSAHAQIFPGQESPPPAPLQPAPAPPRSKLLPTPLPGVTDFTVTCKGARPTTTFMVFTEDKTVGVEVVHHNGLEFMPIHQGIIVPQDLPILQQRAVAMMKLGSYARFNFSADKCKSFGDMLYQCVEYQARPALLNGQRVRAISMYTSRAETRSFFGIEKTFNIAIQLEIDGKNFFQTMTYPVEECTSLRRPI